MDHLRFLSGRAHLCTGAQLQNGEEVSQVVAQHVASVGTRSSRATRSASFRVFHDTLKHISSNWYFVGFGSASHS